MNIQLETFNQVLEIKVYYLIISILLHVGLQTLVNHFHRMRADKEHTEQLNKIEKRLKSIYVERTYSKE